MRTAGGSPSLTVEHLKPANNLQRSLARSAIFSNERQFPLDVAVTEFKGPDWTSIRAIHTDKFANLIERW